MMQHGLSSLGEHYVIVQNRPCSAREVHEGKKPRRRMDQPKNFKRCMPSSKVATQLWRITGRSCGIFLIPYYTKELRGVLKSAKTRSDGKDQ